MRGVDSPDRRCYAFRHIVYRGSRTTAEEPRSRRLPDRTSRTGAEKRKVPAASNRSAAHKVAWRIAGRRSVAVLLRALLRAAS